MRKPMITRTMVTTVCTVMCMDITAGEATTVTISLPRTYKDAKTLMKKVKEAVDTDTIKAVHVVETREEETLYGMTEEDFIRQAMVLPPRKAE